MGQSLPLLSSPPSQRKDPPIARCWGLRELPWHGTKWVEVETMVAWAKRLTWQGRAPIVARSRQGYQTGGALSTRARQAVEARLTRHAEWPTWDMLILPAAT